MTPDEFRTWLAQQLADTPTTLQGIPIIDITPTTEAADMAALVNVLADIVIATCTRPTPVTVLAA